MLPVLLVFWAHGDGSWNTAEPSLCVPIRSIY